MLDLIPLEKQLFIAILLLSAISSVLAHVQIVKHEVKFRRLLVAFASVQVCLSALLLILRAVDLKAFPISGIFESMLILIIFIGITFLFLSAFIQQVWFLSIMVWVLFIATILAAVVAEPASALNHAAQTPWVVFHSLAMSFSGAMIVFASAMAGLFLISRKSLKGAKLRKLLGKMPTIEKLEYLNLLGLRLTFVAMTFGLISGVGLAAVKSAGLGMTIGDWLSDSKIVLIALTWLLLLLAIMLRQLLTLSAKTMANITLIICFLILFAFVGSNVFCKSRHNFQAQQEAQTIRSDYTCKSYWQA